MRKQSNLHTIGRINNNKAGCEVVKECDSCVHQESVSLLLRVVSFGTLRPLCGHEQAANEIGPTDCAMMRRPGAPCGTGATLHEEH